MLRREFTNQTRLDSDEARELITASSLSLSLSLSGIGFPR